MKLLNYQTNILQALKDRLFGSKKPKAAWYYPTNGWTSDPVEITKAIRADSQMTIDDQGNIGVVPDYGKENGMEL